ncbi:unnamed protein product [Cladocopium goreaui]|uniref:Probable transcriptional regulatory protein Cphy_2507 n=1 Tax=Cladocopium goreaui TaxID=2562237 RepID=A0A9P1G5C6_9DINO|nr:unnamed protein product [Cladocopium goreaui]
MIVLAVKEGGPDPATNTMLNRYIKAALKDNLPKDTIDRRIKAFTASSATEGDVERFGDGEDLLVKIY